MNQSLEIVEVNRKALVERWPPGRASRLIAEIREKYDNLHNNKSQNGNQDGTEKSSTIDGMEGG